MSQSPLHSVHEELGARFVDFGGWTMPVQYRSVLDEHRAVRETAGVFDVSHLGRARVGGEDAEEALRYRLSNDVARLGEGRTQYTMMLNDRGGVIDDLMIWRFPDELWIMPNGGNHERVCREIREAAAGVEVDDLRPETVSLAVQGPAAPALLDSLLDVEIRRGRVTRAEFAGETIAVGGTGYTGEAGGEVVASPGAGAALLQAILDAGAVPCGLGARDTLRLEAGLPLWGQDLTEEVTPFQAGMGFAVAWDHDFVGKHALEGERDSVPRSLVAFSTDSRQIPRPANRLRAGASGGWVSSGNFSPALNAGIGMGYLEPPNDTDDIEVEIRGTWHPVRRVTPPFHRG